MNALVEQVMQETTGLVWNESFGFYRPDHTRALNTVLPSMLDLLGSPLPGFPTMTHLLPGATPRHCKRALLLVVDALGYKEFASGLRFPDLYREYGTWVTSVFPTITSCAITSLVQGLTPAQHGITGHEIWKNSPGAVVDMLTMRVVGAQSGLIESGFDVRQWRNATCALNASENTGLPGHSLLPYRFVDSGLSHFAYGHGNRIGYVDFPEGMVKAQRILTEMERGWVSIYNGQIDSLSHVLGGEHDAVKLSVRQIEQNITWLAEQLPPEICRDTLLVVVADHGQNTLRHFLPLHGQPAQWLCENTKAVGFSGRVMHVYLGEHPARPVREYLEGLVGDQGLVLDYPDAAPLTGQVENEAFIRQSLGDLVVLLREGVNWEKRPRNPAASPYESTLVSQHGALTWEELFVPLLTAPLAALAGG